MITLVHYWDYTKFIIAHFYSIVKHLIVWKQINLLVCAFYRQVTFLRRGRFTVTLPHTISSSRGQKCITAIWGKQTFWLILAR